MPADYVVVIERDAVVIVDRDQVDVVTQEVQGPPGAPGGATATVTAGEAIGGHRAVVLDGSEQAFYASRTSPSHAGRVYGISLNAAAIGADVEIARSGPVTEPSWTWTPYLPVFLGTNGLLTQTQPTTGFSQILGVALSATKLFLSVREPIVLT